MAGTLTVTWDNSTPIGGPFRIAYNYPAWNGNPASPGYPASFVITTGVICGTPSCSENISLPIITDEACTPLLIQGYVQPECEDELSFIGRIPFSVLFVPDPPCEAVKFTCTGLSGCSSVDIGTGCHGLLGTVASKLTSTEFSICYLGGLTGAAFLAASSAITSAGYSVEADPATCCYECVELTITFDDTVVGSGGRVQYESCYSLEPHITDINYTPGVPSPPVTVCARPNSWSSDLPAAFTFTVGGPCVLS